MMGMVVMLVTVGIATRFPATAGMFLRTMRVFVAAAVVVLIFAAAAIARCTGRISLRSTAATAVRFGGRALRKKLLPAVLAAKVKCLSLALGMERRRFIHRHSADWVFGHGFTFGLLLGA